MHATQDRTTRALPMRGALSLFVAARAGLAAAVGTMVACAGCSAPVAVRDEGPVIQSEGSSSAVVFPGQVVLDSEQWTGAENTLDLCRRDRELACRTPDTALDQTMWPLPAVPSIYLPRRVLLDTSSQ